MITEKNKPIEILIIELLNFFVLSIIKLENTVINARYMGKEDNFNMCKSMSIIE